MEMVMETAMIDGRTYPSPLVNHVLNSLRELPDELLAELHKHLQNPRRNPIDGDLRTALAEMELYDEENQAWGSEYTPQIISACLKRVNSIVTMRDPREY